MFFEEKLNAQGFMSKFDATEQLNQIFSVPSTEGYLEFCKLITETEELKEYVRPGNEEHREFLGSYNPENINMFSNETNLPYNKSTFQGGLPFDTSMVFSTLGSSNGSISQPFGSSDPYSNADEKSISPNNISTSRNIHGTAITSLYTEATGIYSGRMHCTSGNRLSSFYSGGQNISSDQISDCDTRQCEGTDDLSGDKPEESYAYMIYRALETSQTQTLTLNEIYTWIETNYPYYQTADAIWKNSIRHNLSLNPAFKKIPRPSNIKGKGGYWTIDYEGQKSVKIQRKRRASRIIHNKIQPIQLQAGPKNIQSKCHKNIFSLHDSEIFQC